MTFERSREILEYYVVKAQQPDQADACKIIDEYVASDVSMLETAAETSYAYWYHVRHCHDDKRDEEQIQKYRRAAAVREANRHLEGETFEDAVDLLKRTIDFHKSHQTSLYRQLLSDESSDRRMRIQDELCTSQLFCVRGRDREDRAVIFGYPRKAAKNDGNVDDEVASFVDTIVYTMIRAIACSEFGSGGHQEKIVAVLDTRGSSAPSIRTCKEGVGVLQKHFPGRLKNLIFLNPPFLLMTLYNMVKPFLDPVTKAKFIIVKSDKAKIAEISKLIDVSQAMPTMLPGGLLTSDVDPERYLYDVPFHRLYDEHNRSVTDKEDVQVVQQEEVTVNTATSTFVVDGPGADYGNSDQLLSPPVKKPNFIKSIAIGEIRDVDDDETGGDRNVVAAIVDPVRS